MAPRRLGLKPRAGAQPGLWLSQSPNLPERARLLGS